MGRKIIELREQLFGTKCHLCSEERKIAIHRKDGRPHHPDYLWRLRNLEKLDSEEWTALCIPCHRGVHWLMQDFNQNWKQIQMNNY